MKHNFLLSLVEHPTILRQGKKDSLSRDIQYTYPNTGKYGPIKTPYLDDFHTVFLMRNCFFNDKVFPQNGRYHSSV